MGDQALGALELKIAKFLRAGVLVAGALMLVGWLAGALGGNFQSSAAYAPTPFQDDLSRAWTTGDWPRLVSYGGLMVLISLPFTRVCLTAALFIRQRDWTLAFVAIFVAVALVASVVLGIEL